MLLTLLTLYGNGGTCLQSEFAVGIVAGFSKVLLHFNIYISNPGKNVVMCIMKQMLLFRYTYLLGFEH